AAAWRAVSDPERYNVAAIVLAALTIALIRGLRRVSPLIPGVLVAVLLGLAATAVFGRVTPVLGPMPTALSLPSLALPWGQAGSLVLGAAVIAVVGFAEPAAIARTFTVRGKPWDADRELIAQGAANLVSGVMHGMPVGGSFARSALNRQAGARTRLSGAVAGLAVLPFANVLEGLPRAVLAAIVVLSASSLLQLGALFKLWRYAKSQASTALATFVLTLVMAPRVDYAVVLGISLAVFTHLYRE